ncbi:hypothetical protein [Roseovarius tibetensis]
MIDDRGHRNHFDVVLPAFFRMLAAITDSAAETGAGWQTART